MGVYCLVFTKPTILFLCTLRSITHRGRYNKYANGTEHHHHAIRLTLENYRVNSVWHDRGEREEGEMPPLLLFLSCLNAVTSYLVFYARSYL